MAFTEAELVAQLDSAATDRTIVLQRFIPGATFTDVYAVGVVSPVGGRSRWVQIDSTLTAAQAATAVTAGLR